MHASYSVLVGRNFSQTRETRNLACNLHTYAKSYKNTHTHLHRRHTRKLKQSRNYWRQRGNFIETTDVGRTGDLVIILFVQPARFFAT